MKSFFKFLFNVVRNTSLVIVLLFLAFVFFIANDPELQKDISKRINEKERKEHPTYGILPPVSANKSLVASTSNKESIMAIESTTSEEEEKNIKKLERIEIETIDENAYKTMLYLLPSEIVRLSVDTLYLASGKRMIYKDKITELGESLKSLQGYFISRWDIINCRFVTKMTHKPSRYKSSYKSQYHLTLTDGYEFPIPTKRASEVKKIMKQISR